MFTYYLRTTAAGQAEKKRADVKKRNVAKITGPKVSERQVEKQQRQAAACFASFLGKPVGK